MACDKNQQIQRYLGFVGEQYEIISYGPFTYPGDDSTLLLAPFDQNRVFIYCISNDSIQLHVGGLLESGKIAYYPFSGISNGCSANSRDHFILPMLDAVCKGLGVINRLEVWGARKK